VIVIVNLPPLHGDHFD